MKIICRVVAAALVIGTCQVIGAPADAAQSCIRAGGEGTGLFQGFASFMAQAAKKNQASCHLLSRQHGRPIVRAPRAGL
jgi:hypothetical protein